MGKGAKIGIGLVLVIIVAVVLFTTVLVKNLDGIIKQVVEQTGSEVMNTQVRLGGAKFTLTEGRGELNGLTIANPKGFKTANAFEMDKVAVAVDPASLTGNVIVISEVTIDGARLQAEQKGLKTNLRALLDGMDTGEESAPAEEGSSADVRLMLKQFNFVNSEASLLTQQWGEKSLSMPAIRLSNIGDTKNGLTPAQLAERMTSEILQQVEKAVSNELEKLARDAAKDELDKQLDKNLDEKQKKQLDQVKGLFGKKS